MLFNYWGLLDKNHFFALTYRIFKVHWITWDKLTFKVQTKRALFYFGNILVTVNTEAYEQIYMRTLALQLFGNINVMQNSSQSIITRCDKVATWSREALVFSSFVVSFWVNGDQCNGSNFGLFSFFLLLF
jgi:hypothetical protein